MTSTLSHGNGNGAISGHSLAHQKLSPNKRLALAAGVATGAYQYKQTKAEIAASFKVHPSRLSRVLKAHERRTLAATQATQLAATQAAQRDHDNRAIANIIAGWNSASESARDEAVRKIGLVRLYSVIRRCLANPR